MARIKLTKADINKAFEEALTPPEQIQKVSLGEQIEQLRGITKKPVTPEV